MTPLSVAHIDPSLPALPGQTGPGGSTAVLRPVFDPCAATEAFERVVFPPVVEVPAESYEGWTKAQLYRRAQEVGLRGRSKLSKAGLRCALLALEG